MAKNVEININNGSSYEVLYPKANYSNMNGSLGITDTTGNLPSSRLASGTLTGTFTFSSVPNSTVPPSSQYHLTNKSYVDSKITQFASGSYKGDGTYSDTKVMSVNVGFIPDLFLLDGNSSQYKGINLFGHGAYQYTNTWPVNSNYTSLYSDGSNKNFICFINPKNGLYFEEVSYNTTVKRYQQMTLTLSVNSTSLSWKYLMIDDFASISDSNKAAMILNTNYITYNWIAYKFI